MDEVRYSEDPVADIWQRLLKFSYPNNVNKYLNLESIDNNLVNSISGSIIQSYEYFSAYRKATLNTSPLLLYYGTVNLLYASAMLLQKKSFSIKNHGATLTPQDGEMIGKAVINLSSSPDGAFKVYHDILSNSESFPKKWTIQEVLSYIPEIRNDFEECYTDISHCCIPVEIIKRKGDELERIKLEHIKSDNLLETVVGFKKAYITPQRTNGHLILHKKIFSENIGVLSVSGQKHLICYTSKESSRYFLSEILSFFLGLYSLGVLSRYHPGKWYPFVQMDTTGEKGLIVDFLNVAYRKLPNLLLNKLFDKEFTFTSTKMGIVDLSKNYDLDEIKKMVRDELISSKAIR